MTVEPDWEKPPGPAVLPLSGSLPLAHVARGLLWSAADYAGGRLLSFAAVVYVARKLGAGQFGIYVAAVTFAQTAAHFVDFGSSAFGTREIAKLKPFHASTVHAVGYLRLFNALIAICLCLTGLTLLPGLGVYRRPLEIGCAYLLTYGLMQDWIFGGMRDFKPLALANGWRGAALLAAVVVLIRGGSDLQLAVLLYALAPALSSALLIAYMIRRCHLNPFGPARWEDLRRTVGESWGFLANGLCLTLYMGVPVLIAALVATTTGVGLFAAAFRPTVIAASAVLPLGANFYPLIAERQGESQGLRDTQNLYQHLALLLTLPLALLALAYGQELIRLLYGAVYAQSGLMFRILSITVPVSALRLTVTQSLLAMGRQRLMAMVSLGGLILMSLACYCGGWLQGAVGLAWGVAAAECMLTATCFWLAHQVAGLPLFPDLGLAMPLAVASMLVPVWMPLPLAPRLALSVVFFLFGILQFDPIGKQALRLARASLRPSHTAAMLP